MSRPKKDGRVLNAYIDASVHDALDETCAFLGQTKTLAVERALTEYILTHMPADKVKQFRLEQK